MSGGVALLPVADLNLPLSFVLVWRKDNDSLLLAKFVAAVKLLPEVEKSCQRSGQKIPAYNPHAWGLYPIVLCANQRNTFQVLNVVCKTSSIAGISHHLCGIWNKF